MEGLQHLKLRQIVEFVPGVLINIAGGTWMCQTFLHFFIPECHMHYAYQLNAVKMK